MRTVIVGCSCFVHHSSNVLGPGSWTACDNPRLYRQSHVLPSATCSATLVARKIPNGSLHAFVALSQVEKHSVVKNLIRFGVDVNRGNRNEGHQTAGKNYFREACGSTPGREWALSYAIDSGYISLVHILLAAGSRLPPGEVIDRDTTTSARFFDMDELLKPVIEACSRPVSLQQLCRATVLRAISSRCRAISLQFQNSDRPSPRNIDDAIAALPIASRYRRYLSFDELEGIKIQRARVLDGASAGMFHMEESMPCGLRAVEGGLNVQQAPKHAVSTWGRRRCRCYWTSRAALHRILLRFGLWQFMNVCWVLFWLTASCPVKSLECGIYCWKCVWLWSLIFFSKHACIAGILAGGTIVRGSRRLVSVCCKNEDSHVNCFNRYRFAFILWLVC